MVNNNAQKLIDTAYDELYYLEKASNIDLDGKYDNAGSANYTKYARDCFPELQGLAWCCMFVWWCFERTFGKIMARNLVGEKTAKCSIMKQRMLDNGCEATSDAEVGDLVFFDRGNGISHIGIVYSVGDKSFSTIEGNTSQSKTLKDVNKVIANGGGVFIRAYNFNNPQINDFVRPKWELLKDNTTQTLKEETKPIIEYNCVINAYNVNIRSGAGTHCQWIGNETKGYRFNKIGESKDPSGKVWYKFKYKDKIGYIRSDFVKTIK